MLTNEQLRDASNPAILTHIQEVAHQVIENGEDIIATYDRLKSLEAERAQRAGAALFSLPAGKLIACRLTSEDTVSVLRPFELEAIGMNGPVTVRQDWIKFDLGYLDARTRGADVFLGATMSYPATDQFDPGYLAVREANLTTIKLLGASRGKTEPALPYQLQLGRNMLHRLNVVDASEVPKRRQFWPFQALVSKKDPK